MTINNLEAFVGQLWDWAILDGCFGETRIRPSDVDGIVERNGSFLFLEAKGPDVGISAGQIRTFRALAVRGDTVIILWGNPGQPEYMMVLSPDGTTPRIPCNLADVRSLVADWYESTDKGGLR